jgi:hypothetical protein
MQLSAQLNVLLQHLPELLSPFSINCKLDCGCQPRRRKETCANFAPATNYLSESVILRHYLELEVSWRGGVAVAACCVIGLTRLLLTTMTAMVGMRMLDVHSEERVCIHQVQRQELEETFVTVEGDNQEPSPYLCKPLEKECEAW